MPKEASKTFICLDSEWSNLWNTHNNHWTLDLQHVHNAAHTHTFATLQLGTPS